jgi:AraC-like DNA-binding protein
MVCMKFSRRSLDATVADLDKSLMSAIPASNEALRLLTSYVEILHADPAPLTPELLALGVPHMHDLVSLALGATRDASESAKAGGLRAARLHAIKADIIASLAEPGLGVQAIAARHAISPRYIRALFDSDHTTFTDFVREQRLRRAYRILSDPVSIGRSIGMVALDCGFTSISYFNQAFRRRYGATPTDIRDSAGRKLR